METKVNSEKIAEKNYFEKCKWRKQRKLQRSATTFLKEWLLFLIFEPISIVFFFMIWYKCSLFFWFFNFFTKQCYAKPYRAMRGLETFYKTALCEIRAVWNRVMRGPPVLDIDYSLQYQFQWPSINKWKYEWEMFSLYSAVHPHIWHSISMCAQQSSSVILGSWHTANCSAHCFYHFLLGAGIFYGKCQNYKVSSPGPQIQIFGYPNLLDWWIY